MADDLLAARIDQVIEELIRNPHGDAAAVASLLMAAQVALRKNLTTELALATWGFIDNLQSASKTIRHEVGSATH